MRKKIGLIILVLTVLIAGVACADFTLPNALTVIEPEAFMSNPALTGRLTLGGQNKSRKISNVIQLGPQIPVGGKERTIIK